MTPLLDRITDPADLRELSVVELGRLAGEVRDLLVATVSRTGGHLGPNLGAVELTIALHRVFDSPREPILFDVGHQAYVHKILTGRAGRMGSLRQSGGLSGYPSRAESGHDWIENSHASTALSYADGLAKAFAVRGEVRPVVAVVGDGALTGGMCWEALNNIAGADRPVVVVVNDNGRSYAPTIGGLAQRLSGLRLHRRYEPALDRVKQAVAGLPTVGPALYRALHGMKRGAKDLLAPQGLFEDLGLKYVGPVDGHDITALERAFTLARDFGGPVVVHCVTRKGYGYLPAENDEADQMHQSRGFDPATGIARPGAGRTWTGVFGDELVRIGAERQDVVAVSAAMCRPTGLGEFAARFPDRCYDVGIAEAHAMTSAAGLALGGLHPVVALYSTFANRAFDQLLLDVALHRLPVTIVLDRAGITGEDGPSHNGVWDLAILGVVPGLRMAAPRDEPTLRTELDQALQISDGPTVLRFPKTPLPDPIPTLRPHPGTDPGPDGMGGVDVLAEPDPHQPVDVLLVAIGATATDTLAATDTIHRAGYTTRVIDPRWHTPVPPALLDLARTARLVVTVEDGSVHGGAGSRITHALRDTGNDVPVRNIGVPAQFLAHGSVSEVRAGVGMTPPDIARRVVEACALVHRSTAGRLTDVSITTMHGGAAQDGASA